LPPLPTELLTFPEDKLANSEDPLFKYLSFVTGGNYVNQIIKTFNVAKLIEVFPGEPSHFH